MTNSFRQMLDFARLSAAHSALAEAQRDAIAGETAEPFERFSQGVARAFPHGADWEQDDQLIREHPATPLLVRYLVRSMTAYCASGGERVHALAQAFGVSVEGKAKRPKREALPPADREDFLDRLTIELERTNGKRFGTERAALDFALYALAERAGGSDATEQELEHIVRSFELTLKAIHPKLLPRRARPRT